MATLVEWGEAGTKYRVHEETLKLFEEVRALGEQPVASLSVPAARQQYLNRALKLAGSPDWHGEVREFKVPAPGVPGGIPLEVYRPTDLTQSPPVLVWFHGGGHVVGSRKTVEVMCKIIAKEAKCVVANVEYRLAPEHKPPADFDDAVCVMRWTVMNKALLGGTIESLVGVGGDSGGGQLAASVCFEVPGIAFQVLVYPDVDWRHGHPSFEEFAYTPGLNKDTVNWFRGHYLTDESQESDPRYSPLLRADHSRLPPALIIVAELDPLKDCCYAYKHKLSEAGVQVESFTLKGIPHGFFHLPGHFKETCTKAYGKVCTFIQKYDKRRNNKLFSDTFRTSR